MVNLMFMRDAIDDIVKGTDITLPTGELDAVSGEHRVELIGYGSDQVPEDFARLGDLAPARAELPHETGGVPGGAARQLAPLEEDHVPPPELRQVVGNNYTRRCPLPMMTTRACAGSEAGMAGR